MPTIKAIKATRSEDWSMMHFDFTKKDKEEGRKPVLPQPIPSDIAGVFEVGESFEVEQL